MNNLSITKKIYIIVLSILMLGLGLTIKEFIVSNASDYTLLQNYTKCYKSIRINDGDTLWSIASEFIQTQRYTYESYIEEIKSINHIDDSDTLKAGAYITIPYYDNNM